MLRSRGFTTVELLVAMAVLAVAATLAAPSVASMIASRRVQGAGESLLGGIQFARAEAVRRNASIRFSLRSDGLGWIVSEAATGTEIQRFGDPDWASVLVTSSNGATTLDFLPNGMRQTGTQIDQLTVASTSSDPAERRINVFGGGLIRMCDPALVAGDDPRRC